MLGTEGERTDYAAHLFGMAAGLILGYGYCRLTPHAGPPLRVQLPVAAGVGVLFVLAWHLALR
jgi:membrane associated rhomboid family serine protease